MLASLIADENQRADLEREFGHEGTKSAMFGFRASMI
jgi:hypothetical protein